jgi:hypothetical protein
VLLPGYNPESRGRSQSISQKKRIPLTLRQ